MKPYPFYISPDVRNCTLGPEAMSLRQAPCLELPNSPKLPLFYLSHGFIDPQFGWLITDERQIGRMSRTEAECHLMATAVLAGFIRPTAYRLHATIDSHDTAGMSIYDWFDCDPTDHVLDRDYATADAAQAAAEAAYRGPDVDGISVIWHVEPASKA